MSKIWIALPVPVTPAPAVAVSRTLPPDWIAFVLEVRVSCWTEAAGRRDRIGTLGAIDGVSAGAPELLPGFEPPERGTSLQAAGVARVGSAPAGQGDCPSGVDGDARGTFARGRALLRPVGNAELQALTGAR